MTIADKILELYGEGEFQIKPFDCDWHGLKFHFEKLVVKRNGKTRTTATLYSNPYEINGYDGEIFMHRDELPVNSCKNKIYKNEIIDKIQVLKNS